ncbi:MAG: hypothetical protein GY795_22360 [Desulfobacterales bacterium]|nr:hypothetical protein [Desulfobacterales bacterium]
MCRGYSQPLQRRVTDFGADVPFGKVSGKLEEHYGISIPYSAAHDITEKHAKEIKDNEILRNVIPGEPGVESVIAETDGTMVPVTDTADKVTEGEPADRRKTGKGRWKEARLTLTHPEGSVNPFFGCTPGGPDEAGDQLLNCAIRSGLGQDTKVHCVGDGALRIAGQADRVFGVQAEFLIDFYHLCDYLSSASKICAPDDYPSFFDRQKQLMKENQMSAVLEELRPYIEPDSVPDEKAPVRCCHRYIRNRPGQFDYKGASENGLPIGSGEIESARRYIIQNRLKIAGARWKEDNAQNMISLRVLRANGDWEDYWGNNKAA